MGEFIYSIILTAFIIQSCRFLKMSKEKVKYNFPRETKIMILSCFSQAMNVSAPIKIMEISESTFFISMKALSFAIAAFILTRLIVLFLNEEKYAKTGTPFFFTDKIKDMEKNKTTIENDILKNKSGIEKNINEIVECFENIAELERRLGFEENNFFYMYEKIMKRENELEAEEKYFLEQRIPLDIKKIKSFESDEKAKESFVVILNKIEEIFLKMKKRKEDKEEIEKEKIKEIYK